MAATAWSRCVLAVEWAQRAFSRTSNQRRYNLDITGGSYDGYSSPHGNLAGLFGIGICANENESSALFQHARYWQIGGRVELRTVEDPDTVAGPAKPPHGFFSKVANGSFI